jgi:hypothetical protein
MAIQEKQLREALDRVKTAEAKVAELESKKERKAPPQSDSPQQRRGRTAQGFHDVSSARLTE